MNEQLRVMTYNVHGCVGNDFRCSPERIARVIEALHPDVVAMQEVFVEHPRRRSMHQAAWLAARLQMRFEFGSARACDEGGLYGNAVLSRFPVRSLRSEPLPRLRPGIEPRAALHVQVDAPSGAVDLVNTHLGLRPRERAIQTRALAEDWLSHVRGGSRSVLCGDLNAVPGSRVYGALARLLQDAEMALPERSPAKTWPAPFPFVRLDHVFVGGGFEVTAWRVPFSRAERLASDHLPIVVDLLPRGGGA